MKLFRRISILTLVLLLPVMSVKAQIFTWVDENGKKHFGDSVPPAYRGKKGDKITVDTIEPSREEVERAKQRYKRFEVLNKKETDKRRAARYKANKSNKKTSLSDYEQKLAEYNESQECFKKCRVKIEDKIVTQYINGVAQTKIIPGGYNNANCGHCKEVSKPVR
jgi:hypothetical protein